MMGLMMSTGDGAGFRLPQWSIIIALGILDRYTAMDSHHKYHDKLE